MASPFPLANLLAHRQSLTRHTPRLRIYSHGISKIYLSSQLLGSQVEVKSDHNRVFTKDNNATTNQVPNFKPTLRPSKHLWSLVSNFPGLRRYNLTTGREVFSGPTCIFVRKMHYAPTAWDPNIHKLPVISVDTPYPASSKSDNTDREAVFSLFSIPTLRHLTLRGLTGRFPEGYRFVPEDQRVEKHLKGREKTSSVEYLSIRDTQDERSTDLREIMCWPKALKGFDLNPSLTDEFWSDWPWDVSTMVPILQPQHASLEQISIDTPELTGGTFGTSLRNFPKLKRLSMPRNFLVKLDEDGVYVIPYDIEDSYLDYGMEDLPSTLPPALEELVLNIDNDVKYLEDGERPEEDFKESFKQVAMRKQELYPSLKRVVLWTRCDLDEFTPEEIDVKEREVNEMLGFSDLFKSVGVEFVYKVSLAAPGFQDPYVCSAAESGQVGDTGKVVEA